MSKKARISVRQVTVLMFMSLIGDMLLIYPTMITHIAHQDAWISSILSIPLGLIIIYVLIRVHELHPNLTLIEAIRKILGPVFGTIISCWYLFYFFMGVVLNAREVGDYLTTQIFEDTPLRVLLAMEVLMLVLAALAGIEAFSRVSEILIPVYIFIFSGLILALLPQIHLSNVRPVLENGLAPVAKGMVPGAAMPFAGMSIMLMVFPFVNKKGHFKRDMLLASLLGGVLISLFLLLSLLVIGPFVTNYSPYISSALSTKINELNYITRIESLVALLWALVAYFKGVILFFAFTFGITQLFRISNVQPFIIPAGALVYGMTILVTPNVFYYVRTLVYPMAAWHYTNGLIIPLLLWIVYLCRRKWKQRQNISKH
ncbi:MULTISPECIES: GerAB/ArcD/ProY family transporter [Paenibacillus]|uniref:GerAB/ArcD/ProY family transporter n=1 Tax=Paenibacillus TaxID=44249 RepID=UPI0004DECEE9|nr:MULTISPECIES: endospore germination permease [Paenibacillus]KAF6615265.1 endospore germination permease [Paenibacillus sp. EKM101P]KAF6618867.1 endospore germination permease [Paenibacillus sp. EKM102P]KAF6627113.1 endospore germination permease [Paenibacillus sp. EKM10P]KAF6643625.1 endospore germination permease [Paenibacillus sp. EKM11P]MEE4581382.1 endospore germination permease [Paenibacillus polymyxa]